MKKENIYEQVVLLPGYFLAEMKEDGWGRDRWIVLNSGESEIKVGSEVLLLRKPVDIFEDKIFVINIEDVYGKIPVKVL